PVPFASTTARRSCTDPSTSSASTPEAQRGDLARHDLRSTSVTTCDGGQAMRRTTLWLAVLVAALVGALVPAVAYADGLPVLGIDVGGTGVASSSDASRYVTIPAASRTIVARVAQHGGQILAWRSLRGTFTIPVVAYD